MPHAITCDLAFAVLAAQKHSQLVILMDPKDTTTVGSAALETNDDDPTSRVVVSVAEPVQGQVHGVQGRMAPQDQSNEQQQGVTAKDNCTDERTTEAMSHGWQAHKLLGLLGS